MQPVPPDEVEVVGGGVECVVVGGGVECVVGGGVECVVVGGGVECVVVVIGVVAVDVVVVFGLALCGFALWCLAGFFGVVVVVGVVSGCGLVVELEDEAPQAASPIARHVAGTESSARFEIRILDIA
jgi:hypothetical protein